MSDSNNKVGVLFVCMGNICRSPTGEGVFKHYVAEAGHADKISIDSAGTIGYHAGGPADGRMRAAASQRGYSLDSIARQVTRSDLDDFDLVIPMDHDNLAELEHLANGPQSHLRLLGTFLDGANDNARAAPVPDPYYGGAAGFEEVLDMVESACPAILEYCLEIHHSRHR